MTSRARAVATWLLVVPLLLGGLGAHWLGRRAWAAFTQYQPPFPLSTPGAAGSERLARQVVVVLVDGLAYHASRSMPFLNELRAQGADLECRAGLPSLSLPGRSVMLSGAWQEIHGQTTNFHPRPLPVEHVFETARRHGRTTALAAGASPHLLFEPHVDERIVYPRLEGEESQSLPRLRAELFWMGEATRALQREKRPDLFLIDYTIADEAGHRWGAASAQYGEAAQALDAEIRKLAAEIDLRDSVLIVTSDHGHTARGGHGGPEEDVLRIPLVLAGGPVRKGVRGECRQVDLAPTLAALLGAPLPASNQGQPLAQALDLTAAQQAALRQNLWQQRRIFVDRYVAWVSERAAPPADGAAGAAGSELEDLDKAAAQARGARMSAEARGRALVLGLALAVLVFAPWALLASGLVTRAGLALAALGALAAAVAYFGLLRAVGLDYSFSTVNRDEALGPFFRKNMILAVGACAVAVATAAAWLARRTAAVGWSDLARLALLISGGLAGLLALKMAIVYWRQGIFLRWQMPDLFWGFGFYLDTLALMAVCLAAPLMPLVAWAAAKLPWWKAPAPPVGQPQAAR